MAKASEIRPVEKISTTLGKETAFKGIMRFSKALKIDGSFEGEITSAGALFIEDGAVVKANIRVKSVVVGGIVEGNIEASEKVEMLATGKVYGNVKTAKLRIADGVVFEGKCEMIRDPEAIDIFSGSAERLKSTLSGA